MNNEWSLMEGADVCRELQVNHRKGLSENDARRRKIRWGKNSLKEVAPPSLIGLFVAQFRDFLILVLMAATLVSGLMGEYVDAVTILAIILLNALLGTFQEYRAERSLRLLKELSAPRAMVRRDGAAFEVAAEDIVPGDIVLFEPGDRVCADMRLLETRSLILNEASLTGESVPVSKSVLPMETASSSPGDMHNMVFSGTLIVEGRGSGVVVETGMNTQIGQIAHLIEHAEVEMTPLQKRLSRLGHILVAACLSICALVVILGIWRGEPAHSMFMAGVSLAVAAIPEGLPAIVTVSLALGVQRMVRRRAIVRRLPAVETLGSATVICSDKTGTLTQNRMSLREVYTSGTVYRKDGGDPWCKISPESGSRRGNGIKSAPNPGDKSAAVPGTKISPGKEPPLLKALQIGCACNNAALSMEESGRTAGVSRGDPTEIALLEAGRDTGLRKGYKRVGEMPFSAERKRMTVIIKDTAQKAMVKGAPETILQRCRYIMDGEKPRELTVKDKDNILNKVEEMADNALRTLAVAYRDIRTGENTENAQEIEKNLIWVGLLGLEDPPRPEVLPAVKTCHNAGIKVVMITGDHSSTAVAIARRLNILKSGYVITGDELDNMSDKALYKIIDQVEIFARVNPGHKLRVVRAFKKRGHVVAMTGDGVNDAPAVKEADIGVAMGISGTEVTKEAAALVLEDDNFTSIVAAVEEGRNIYANIRKFIRFLLCCNTGEILTMLITILVGLPLPLRPIQILWVNLITDGLPAMALGVEPPDKQIMQSPPRGKTEGIFTMSLWMRIVCRGLLIALSTIAVFVYTLQTRDNLLYAQTAALTTLIFTQLVFVFECRTEKVPFWKAGIKPNYYLYAAVTGSFLLLFPILYNSFFRNVFQTVPLNLQDWLLIASVSLIPQFFLWVWTQFKKTA